jgi:Ca2+-binding EF-hand superfamily protein
MGSFVVRVREDRGTVREIGVPDTSTVGAVIKIASEKFGGPFAELWSESAQLTAGDLFADYFEPEQIFTLRTKPARRSQSESPRQPGVDPAQVEPFMALFREADCDGTGIDKDGWNDLFRKVAGSYASGELCEVYFKGIDIDLTGKIGEAEFREFVEAAYTSDQYYTVKMAFRAYDRDRSGMLSAMKIQKIGLYIGQDIWMDAIKAKIQEITGDENNELSFADVVHLLTGRIIAGDTDPYE